MLFCPDAGFALCMFVPISPLCLSVMGSILLCSYTASIAPLRAFNLVNSLNSSQGAGGQITWREKKSRIIYFLLFYFLSLFLFSPYFRPPLFSWLAFLKGPFAFHLLMRCILSFSIAPLPCPFWVLLTNSRIYVEKKWACAKESFAVEICDFAWSSCWSS